MLNLESSTDIYTPPCLKQIASWKMLFSTGSSAWCSVMTQKVGKGGWVGQSQEGGDICIYITDSHRASLIAQVVKNPPAMQETSVQFLGWKDPLEKGQATHSSTLGFLIVAQLVKNPPARWETWVGSLDWEDPLEKGKATTPVFSPGEFHRLYSPWGHKEPHMTEQLSLSFSLHN